MATQQARTTTHRREGGAHEAAGGKRVFLSDPSRRVSPVATEPIASDFAAFIGGPLGRFARAGTQRLWTPIRVLIVASLTFLSLGFLAKANCIQGNMVDGVAVLDWAGNRQYTSACYNDIVPLYGGRGLDAPGFPYAYSWVEGERTRYMEYPVLAGIFQWIMAVITRAIYPAVEVLPLAIPEVAVYFSLSALVMGMMWVCVVRLVAELAGNRVWDAILVACSPLVIMHAFTNWDIPSILAATLALWAFSRRNAWMAGVWIGIGISIKLWPLFLLGAYFVLSVRSRNFVPLVKMTVATVVTWVVCNVGVWLAYPQAWGEFYRLNTTRGWEWTTIYAVISREFGWAGFDGPGTPTTLNTVSFILFLGACAAIAALGIMVARRPRVAELCYLIVAAFLLTNNVWSPQYSLWLVVLAALALPNWRLIFAWALTDALTWPVLMWHMMGEDNKGVPGHFLDIFVLGRDGFIIAIAVLVIRQMLGKRVDPVRRDHDGHDPLAGELDDEIVAVVSQSPVKKPAEAADVNLEAEAHASRDVKHVAE